MVAGAEATDRPRQGFLIFHFFFSVLFSVEHEEREGYARVLRSFERIDARKWPRCRSIETSSPLYGRIGNYLE